MGGWTTRPTTSPGSASPTRVWFEAAFARPTAGPDRRLAGDRGRPHALVVAPTGSGKTLGGVPVVDRPARPRASGPPTSEALPGALRLAAEGARGRRRAQPARPAGRHPAHRRPARVPRSPTSRSACGRATPPRPSGAGSATSPPDILITTPESLFLMLTSQARESLRGVETVIVDEVHAVAGTKRGAHLALSLERLDELLERPAQRIGLSATVRPVEEVARFLGGAAPVEVVAPPSEKKWDLKVVVPVEDMTELGVVEERAVRGVRRGQCPARLDLAARRGARRRPDRAAPVDDRLRQLPPAGRAAHRPAQRDRHRPGIAGRLRQGALAPRLEASGGDHGPVRPVRRAPSPVIARAHHGSVSKEQRAVIEDDLKRGRLPVRGRDQQPRARHRHGCRRPGRSRSSRRRRWPARCSGSAVPVTRSARSRAGCCSPSTAATWCRPRSRSSGCAAAASRRCACRPTRSTYWPSRSWPRPRSTPGTSTTLFAVVRRSRAVRRRCPRSAYDATLDLLAGRYPSDEFAELRPRIVWDRVAGDAHRPTRGAAARGHQRRHHPRPRPVRGLPRRASGPSRVGELDEEMVYESRVGDVFALGATSWRIEDITHDRVLVSPAPGQPGRLPFWKGDTLGRPAELGAADRCLHPRDRRDVQARRSSPVRRAPASTSGRPTTWSPSSRSSARRPTRCRPTARSWSSASATSSATGGSWCTRPTAHRCTRPGRWRSTPGCASATASTRRRWPPTTASCCASPRPTRTRPAPTLIVFEPDEIEQIVTTEVGGSALFASRFRECAARALLLPRRDPGRRSPLWQQRQRSAQLLEVASQVPVLPDHPRGGARGACRTSTTCPR